jgi:hypothetical protein
MDMIFRRRQFIAKLIARVSVDDDSTLGKKTHQSCLRGKICEFVGKSVDGSHLAVKLFKIKSGEGFEPAAKVFYFIVLFVNTVFDTPIYTPFSQKLAHFTLPKGEKDQAA